jgi:zinc protease
MNKKKPENAFLAKLLISATVLSCLTPVSAQEGNSPQGQNDETGTRFSLPAAGTLETGPAAGRAATGKAATGSARTAGALPAMPAYGQTKSVDAHSQQAGTPAVTQSTARGARTVGSSPVPVPAVAAVTTGQAAARQATMVNGLKVLVLENHEFPVVSVLVWYKVGSRDEAAGGTGLSHMVEHLMFQEVGQFKPQEMGSAIARVGGQFNGYTSDDFTTFFETLPAAKLEMALKIEADRMYRTRFSAGEIKKEVVSISAELDNEAKDPVALVSKEVRAAMFTKHPYHNPIIGKRSDLEALTAEHAKAFYEKYFTPANATLVLAGDLNWKTTMPLVAKYFGTTVKPQPVNRPPVSEPPQHAERKVSCKYAGNRDVLQVAYRAPAMESADAPAMVVLERLLNGGSAGRLKTKLIDSRVCASAQASYDIKKESGLFSITCNALPGMIGAQARMLENVDFLTFQLKDKAPGELELRRAKNQAEFSYFAECDGPYRAGFHLGYFECLDKWQNSYTWADKIRAVTSADINRVAKKYLVAESRVVGWISGTQVPKPKTDKASGAGNIKERRNFISSKPFEHLQVAAFQNADEVKGWAPANKAIKTAQANETKEVKASAPAGDGKETASASDEKETASVSDKKEAAPASDKKEAAPASDKKETTTAGDKKETTTASGTKATVSGTKDTAKGKPATKTKEKKSGIPAVIHDIPSALGNVVTGNIPGAVGNVGSAIINLPGAIGNIGTAVGGTATALGKQIVNLKPAENEYASHHFLKNGVHLVVYPSKISPVVQICGSLQAGEAYSPRNKPGYSLLAASFLNQGSIDHNRQQMIAAQDDLGIAPAQMLKFESNDETIDFSARCLSRDLSAELNLLAETLVKPDLLDDGTIDKAQQDALAVLKRSEESPSQKADRILLTGLLDENSPFLPADPSDTSRTITTADLSQAQKFFSTHVVPGATTIAFIGDCNPAEVFALAEKAFADWEGKGSHAQAHAKMRGQRVLRSTIPIKESKKTSVCFGQIMPLTRSHPEYGSLLLADSILVNHPMFSRFEKALSKNPALESAIAGGDMHAKLEPVSNLTCWSLSLSLDPSAVANSIRTIRGELKQIARSGVAADEFTEAKRYLLGCLPVRTQSTLGSIGNYLMDSLKHGDGVNGYAFQMASIKAATLESVNKVIRNTFKPGESVLVIAGGAQSIKAGRSPAASEPAPSDRENGTVPAVAAPTATDNSAAAAGESGKTKPTAASGPKAPVVPEAKP